MKSELFAELLESAQDALDHAKGKRDLRSTELPRLPHPMTADDVRRVRKQLRASQALFARYLNVSTKLVQAWEGQERTPAGPALVLLRLLEKHPGMIGMFHPGKTRPSRERRRQKSRGTAR